MSSLKKLEIRVRTIRDSCIHLLYGGMKGRKRHRKTLGKDIRLVTRELKDHLITFNPHETIGKFLYIRGNWEREETEKVIQLLEDHNLMSGQKSVLELGANIGTQTLYFHLSNKFQRVISVEADPYNASILLQNVRQNNFSEKTVVVDCAIAEQNGKVTFFKHETNQGRHSLIALDGNSIKITVEAKKLDKIFADYKVSKDEIGFVWIDLEGYDFEAIQQVAELLGTDIPVFTEFSPEHYGREKTRKYLEFIQSNYQNCFIFSGCDEIIRVSTKEIPTNIGQLNLLLCQEV